MRLQKISICVNLIIYKTLPLTLCCGLFSFTMANAEANRRPTLFEAAPLDPALLQTIPLFDLALLEPPESALAVKAADAELAADPTGVVKADQLRPNSATALNLTGEINPYPPCSAASSGNSPAAKKAPGDDAAYLTTGLLGAAPFDPVWLETMPLFDLALLDTFDTDLLQHLTGRSVSAIKCTEVLNPAVNVTPAAAINTKVKVTADITVTPEVKLTSAAAVNTDASVSPPNVNPHITTKNSTLVEVENNANAKAKETTTDNDDEFEFNTSFLSLASRQHLDIKRFEQGSIPPGIYRVDLLVNDTKIGLEDITVKDKNSGVDICLKRAIFKKINLDYTKLPVEVVQRLDAKNNDQQKSNGNNSASNKANNIESDSCLLLSEISPAIVPDFDLGELRLKLNIPQILLDKKARGYISYHDWDRGINAITLGYNTNFYHSNNRGNSTESFYAALNSGVNLQGWYLRHNGSYNWDRQNSGRYSTNNTYLQRDLPALKSRILVGETNTTGQLFDSISFTGVRLANEDRMLPNSLRGYAPIIVGVAQTSAKVVVRQLNKIIYETTVPAGEFEIDDLYPTGYGGNLEVTIEEADGSQRSFELPYSSVANLLRPGTNNYSITTGKMRNSGHSDEPYLTELTYSHGISNYFTAYGGTQFNADYLAGQLGGALGTSVGAFSFDVTHSSAKLADDKKMSGQSYQLKYNKRLETTRSHISLSGYRFSTDGYADFTTAMNLRDAKRFSDSDQNNNHASQNYHRTKNRLALSFNQQLHEGWGNFYLSGYMQNYWNKEQTDRQYQIGYNNSLKRVNYSLMVSRSRSELGKTEDRYTLSLSIPLSDWAGLSSLGIDISRSPDNVMREQINVNGSAGAQKQLNYGASFNTSNKGGASGGSIYSNYHAPQTMLNMTASKGTGYRSVSGGLSGGMVAHRGGVTLSSYSSDTYGLIEAKGAAGARVSSYSDIKVDRWGYALVPHLNPYHLNDVWLDPKGLSNNVELDVSSSQVVPYSGAVVKLNYQTTKGYPVLLNASFADGRPLPFGADVLDTNGQSIGMVGQGSKIFARLADSKGQFIVRWSESEDGQCQIDYQLSDQTLKGDMDITPLDTVCKSAVKTDVAQ